MTQLLEWLAPTDNEDGSETRSFAERLHDADAQRAESTRMIWERVHYDSNTVAYWSGTYEGWEIQSCWQLTNWIIGFEFSSTLPAVNWEGRRVLTIGLGPYSICISRITRKLKRTGRSL